MKRKGDNLQSAIQEALQADEESLMSLHRKVKALKPQFAKCMPQLVAAIETVLIRDLAKMVADYARPRIVITPSFPHRFRVNSMNEIDQAPGSDDVHICIEREGGICNDQDCDCMPDSLWIEVKDELGVAGRTELHPTGLGDPVFHFWNSRWVGTLGSSNWSHPNVVMASKWRRISTKETALYRMLDALAFAFFRPKPSASFQRPGFVDSFSSQRRLQVEFRDLVGDAFKIGLLGDATQVAEVMYYLTQAHVGFRREGEHNGSLLNKTVKHFEDEDEAICKRASGKISWLWDLRKQDDTTASVDIAFPSPVGVPEALRSYYWESIAHRLLLGDHDTIGHMKAITEAKKQVRVCKVFVAKPLTVWDGTPE